MTDDNRAVPEVLETGIPALDRILGGGLLRGSIAMVIGAPGSGKTVLAEQIAFHAASQGRSTLYLTAFSESHEKLLRHGRGLAFFRPDAIGREVQFANLADLLRAGVEETEDAILTTARGQRAALVVLDGFRGMRGFLADDHEVAHFIYSLGSKLALLGATTLLLVEGNADQAAQSPELTACDVVLALRRESVGSRDRRLLQPLKVRGAAPLIGSHPFVIDMSGVSVFPRWESLVSATEPAWEPGRAPFGIAGLDSLIGGGLNVGTTTLIAGSPGVGKTTLSLHFIAQGASAGEPALFLGFMESPAQLREKARLFGTDLGRAETAGQVHLRVLPAHDLEADAIVALLAEDIERRGVRRLVIDSAAEIERALGFQGRVPDFLGALTSYLRGRRITTVLTRDIPLIVGPFLEFTGTPLSVFVENLLLLRQVEYRGHLHQVLSVLKMRFSDYDRAIYEYRITPGQGLRVVGPAPLGEGLLTGVPRVPAEPPAPGDPGKGEGAS